MQIENGTYAGNPVQQRVYKNEKGSLVVFVELLLRDVGEKVRAYNTLATIEDGPKPKVIKSMKAWSGWDGIDPFWFQDTDLSHIDVDVVIENQPGMKNPGKMYPSVKYINPPGGTHSDIPEPGDRKAILAEYGAKFRALAGGSTMKQPAKPNPSVQPNTPAPSVQPEPTAPSVPSNSEPNPSAEQPAAPKKVSDLNECWKKFQDINPGKFDGQLAKPWYAAIRYIGEGRKQEEFTPEDWGRMMDYISSGLPF